MIALYLGIAITVLLIIVGIAVECLRKRYYSDNDNLLSSSESYDDSESIENFPGKNRRSD